MIRFSTSSSRCGRAVFIIYYLLWTVVRHNRKDPGKTSFTTSQDISLGYNILRQENSFFGAWKSWTIYTSTNTTAKNGMLMVVEADDCWQTGYLS